MAGQAKASVDQIRACEQRPEARGVFIAAMRAA
jgi:hypothetical protein